jgi:dolichyl-phosphate-mannose--protein O-mannosyl transferase
LRDRYDPREGLAAFRAPLDYALAAAFGIANFALCGWRYWRPPDRIFDEVYFARAAHEYLTNQRIYENTHPPLSKLLITASVWLFGGIGRGDSALAWRFLDVCFASLAVVMLYTLAKRITGSSAFAAVAAALFTFDGMHFVQARIATPESFVGFFALAALYALYRVWIAAQFARRASVAVPWWGFAAGATACACAGLASALAARTGWHFDAATTAVVAAYVACGAYAFVRRIVFPAAFGSEPREGSSELWLWIALLALALGCLIATKWYGITLVGLTVVLLAFVASQPAAVGPQAAPWVDPDAYHLDGVLAALVFGIATVYALAWVPDLVRQSPDPAEIHSFDDVVARQYTMFEYHDVGVRNATHPYSSKWWEWPLDYVPVAYYYRDDRRDPSDPKGCCISEITSMPNPVLLWCGLICVPAVGWIGWRQRRKGYVLLAAAYLAQWLPWAASPRLAWEYHFYVNVPLICLCEASVLQHFWLWGKNHRHRGNAWMAAFVAAGFVGCAAAAFVFFYPVLAARPISEIAWHARMWLPTWVIGPG